MLGRSYRAGEDEPGKNDVAVLSYDVWQTNFDGQTGVVGRTLELNGHPYTCIGVMPAGFRYPLSAMHAIYTPLHPDSLDGFFALAASEPKKMKAATAIARTRTVLLLMDQYSLWGENVKASETHVPA